MAPLSRELVGVILPHNEFGDHLDGKGKTIDLELEKKNFAKAGEVLSEIWNSLVIDNHPVRATYVSEETLNEPDSVDAKWYSDHV